MRGAASSTERHAASGRRGENLGLCMFNALLLLSGSTTHRTLSNVETPPLYDRARALA